MIDRSGASLPVLTGVSVRLIHESASRGYPPRSFFLVTRRRTRSPLPILRNMSHSIVIWVTAVWSLSLLFHEWYFLLFHGDRPFAVLWRWKVRQFLLNDHKKFNLHKTSQEVLNASFCLDTVLMWILSFYSISLEDRVGLPAELD